MHIAAADACPLFKFVNPVITLFLKYSLRGMLIKTNENRKTKTGKNGRDYNKTGVGIVSKGGPVEELTKQSGVASDDTIDRDATHHDLLLSPESDEERSDAFSFLSTIFQ